MTPRNRWITAAAAAAAVALLAWAFAPRPLAVETAPVVLGAFERVVVEDGRTRLRERYVVSAPLAGRLERITLLPGDPVAANAEVARQAPGLAPMLDARSSAQLRERIAAAQAALAQAATRSAAARIALEQAEAARRRSDSLAQQGFVSPTQAETDRLATRAAEQALATARAGEDVASHELAQARAALATAQSAAQSGDGGAGFVVRAPVAGQVLRVLQESEGMVALGTPLVELGDLSRLEIVAELLTTDALQASAGTPVRIERWGGPEVLEGRVERVEPGAFTKISALGVEEQRVRVRVAITSPRERWAALGDGFRVGLGFVVERQARVPTVPLAALFPRPVAEGGGPAVFVLKDGRAVLTPVTVKARGAGSAWVGDELPEGATVIVYPPAALRDGARVTVRQV
jgi:HlyD family secretion protein